MSNKRKKIPEKTITAITTKSRRVCAMCWGLQRDGRGEKEGQIAHINGQADDNSQQNLCWLCLFHHNRYDGRMRLSKNHGPQELRVYKKEVEVAVAAERLPTKKRQAGALLAVKVVTGILSELCSGRPKFEAQVICSNEGSAPTGLQTVCLNYRGQQFGRFNPWLGRPEESQVRFHPSSRSLLLSPDQVIQPGSLAYWSIHFDSLLQESEFIPKPGGLGLSWSLNSRQIDPPLELTLSPISGVPVTVVIDEILTTTESYAGIIETERLNREAQEESELSWFYQLQDQWRIRALKQPFPRMF